jgi:hypothetical protein
MGPVDDAPKADKARVRTLNAVARQVLWQPVTTLDIHDGRFTVPKNPFHINAISMIFTMDM